ncbi:FAD-binding and (Fe-S)-binding domain-containing protein [Fluviispira multicolorata]|uniref:FAD-binding protein n=1 Tax=Fluviispira multicolorata TaxID=2654512 RepID=A0A833JBQ3_9BACT|nr:FAD-binding and (Fe-S)-binding domain-containing protein [Fluviispira multicolorata]KAB8029766.1 FAD-binding protein [Fluviispira multicolorata]
MNTQEIDNWLDIAGLMPPMPNEAAKKLYKKLGVDTSGKHTFLPSLITRNEYANSILPLMKQELNEDLFNFINKRVEKTFEIRNKLKTLQNRIIEIVGEGNFSALWLDREAFSADSMEHRALITEAVIHIYSSEALQKIVTLFYNHNIPMIPYGEGGGYNMGVTPMAPAVTISLRGIDHISEIKPSRRTEGKFEVSVGSGVPFKDLVAYLAKRGFVLRCDPNTPRAATGGIAATGSNGGRKAFEVILHGRAVTSDGTALCFAADKFETDCINNEPFLLARKFFSIENTKEFESIYFELKRKKLKACITPNSTGVVIPLQGMKANANMLAQKAEQIKKGTSHIDTMEDSPTLPISAFVGAEGSTGFIYEVTFEIDKPLEWLQASRWHFNNVDAAMCATRAIKKLPKNEQPEYFEFISGQSIKRFLIHDFPTVFSNEDEAVIILAVEGNNKEECALRHMLNEKMAHEEMLKNGYKVTDVLIKMEKTNVLLQSEGIDQFEVLRKPREELPKKLRTKCKTDMEIRTEYLGEVLKIVAGTNPRARATQKQDVLFGHLTPNHTAIIHWNIGGFDLYDEEQADIAWDYLENVIGKAQSLAPANDKHGSARFTGEHGVAGKAPFLWLNYIPENDFKRMCAVKDTLDEKDLFNPETLFLRTSHSRALRARLLNTSAKFILDSLAKTRKIQNVENSELVDSSLSLLAAENYAVLEGQRCTRCNSCKVCPVIDAEHELERENRRKSKQSVLPSKRNILMFMEKITHIRRAAEQTEDKNAVEKIFKVTAQMMKESASLLSKCFYCRKCDKACPVDIEIHPLMRAYHKMGKLPSMGSKLWGFIYERLMGEDFFKSITYRLVAFFIFLGAPFLYFIRKLSFIPDWIKSYTVPPTLAFAHYEPVNEGAKIEDQDNFVIISKDVGTDNFIANDLLDKETVYIRYRGCMDTFGKPEATTSVDEYFKSVLNSRIVDLEKKMCCGFPFEADGLHERAKQSQILSLIEIAKCINRLIQECKDSFHEIPKFIVFSNCPTCCEAIKEMRELLKSESIMEQIRIRSKIPDDFNMKLIDFDIQDTAELAMSLIKKSKTENIKISEETITLNKVTKTVGLKVPCHNTKAATQAQIELLKMYYTGVASYDRCCGLSGTGRLKHPKIGTKISEKLFEQIREEPPSAVVTGCPSCRDGVKMQRDILAAKKDSIAEFEVSGIFEQILKDCKKVSS